MNSIASRPTDKVSKFVREALLAPQQVNDVAITEHPVEESTEESRPFQPTHAHADTGHADY